MFRLNFFVAQGFSQHKIQILTKLADYVTHVDRSAGRSTSKTAFVVANEVLGSLGDINSASAGLSSATVDGLIASAESDVNLPISEMIRAHLVNKGHNSSFTTGLTSSGAKRRPSTGGGTTISKGRSLSNPRSREFAPLSPTVSMTLMKNKNSTFSPSGKVSSFEQFSVAGKEEKTDSREETPRSAPAAAYNKSPPRASLSAANGNSSAAAAAEMSTVDLQKIDDIINQKVETAVKEISEKYDMVLNKLVAAVDAEFTILNNRIRALESMVSAENKSNSNNNASNKKNEANLISEDVGQQEASDE